MFQSVGTQAVVAQARSMNIPLYQQTIKGFRFFLKLLVIPF